MANTFKNYVADGVGTSDNTLRTIPASTTGVTIGCNLANVTDSSIEANVKVNDVYVVKGAPIPANSALSVLDGKIVLESGDAIKVSSNTAASLDVVLSILEIT